LANVEQRNCKHRLIAKITLNKPLMIRSTAAIAALFLVSCTYAPRSTKIDQNYTARQMAVGVTSQPNGGITSTTTVEEAPASGETIPSSQQHLATYPEVRVAELANQPTNGRAISGAANFLTIGSTKNDVARIQGTPSKVSEFRSSGSWWTYGYSRIEFDRNGRIESWDNYGGNLKVKMVLQ